MPNPSVVMLALSLLGAGWFFGQALWLQGKAVLAQQLIALAWERTLEGGEAVRPWPWADTLPVARLTIPGGEQLFVLEGTHGQALAFGPGHLSASARPGMGAPVVVAGHRDSHFSFLRDLAPGASMSLQGRDGRVHRYRVSDSRVVDSRSWRLALAADGEVLVLVTCYPFETLAAGGPLRYVVTALPWRDGHEGGDVGDGSAD